jgi:glycosyltransferase involved in cell wall biosynthesis
MPRIGFILQAFYGDQIGGAERQVEMLARALQKEGWSAAYICERPPGKPLHESVDGIDVFALPERKKRSAWLNFGALKHALQESQADLFYQRVRHPYTGLSSYIARKLQKPIVFAAASIADTIRTRDLRWSSHAGNPIDMLLHPVGRYIEDWGLHHVDDIVLQTTEQQAQMLMDYARDGHIIPNHITIHLNSGFSRKEPPQVLWISNIKVFKRPEIFIQLAERCRDLNAQFVMAGACPNGNMLQIIKQAVDRLENFNYVGPISPTESEKWIAESTLLINTSKFEGFPNAFQQAWANGIPTLSIGIDPDGVISAQGLGGCVAGLDEMERLTRDLLADASLRGDIGEKAIQFAQEAYDIKKLLPRYLSLFESLIRK